MPGNSTSLSVRKPSVIIPKKNSTVSHKSSLSSKALNQSHPIEKSKSGTSANNILSASSRTGSQITKTASAHQTSINKSTSIKSNTTKSNTTPSTPSTSSKNSLVRSGNSLTTKTVSTQTQARSDQKKPIVSSRDLNQLWGEILGNFQPGGSIRQVKPSQARPGPAPQWSNDQLQSKINAAAGDVKSILAKHTKDTSAQQNILQITSTPGFSKFSNDERTHFLNLIGGTNKIISFAAREKLAGLLANPNFVSATADSQHSQLVNFMTQGQYAWHPGETLPDTQPVRHLSLGPQLPVFDPLGHVTGKMYQVQSGGHTVNIYTPVGGLTTVAQGNHLPNTNQAGLSTLVSALEKVPDYNFNLIDTIDVSNDHPGANASTNWFLHKIVYFPNQPENPSLVDNDLVHETGHMLESGKLAKDPSFASKWRNAMSADYLGISNYPSNVRGRPNGPATQKELEDFAETMRLYQLVKGTGDEAEVGALFKSRITLLKELMAESENTNNPQSSPVVTKFSRDPDTVKSSVSSS